MDTVTNRVKRGAALLDKHVPGWEREITTSELDVWDSCECPLGQLFGQYSAGLRALDILASGLDDSEAIRHGFEASFPAGRDDYDQLTDAWIRLVTSRTEGVRYDGRAAGAVGSGVER